VADRFKPVQQEKLDFREVLLSYDGLETFFFCDPPYHPATRDDSLYQHEMGEKDHADLLNLLIQAKGKVWLCGYDSDQYAEALPHWRRQPFTGHKKGRTEIVWTNFLPINPKP
jgi:DNA adenine methylase